MSSEFLEKQILGCFIKDNTLLKETNIKTYHFDDKNDHHKVIYNAMLKLTNEGQPVDHITLMTECYNMLTELGGVDYIMGIQTKGNPDNFEGYVQKLMEQYKSRAANKVLQSFMSNEEQDIPDLLKELQEIDMEGHEDESQVTEILSTLLNKPYEEPDKNMTGIPSGLKQLDKKTGGWQKRTSIVVGARPSMGKTALMLKFARSAGANGDIPLIFSLEMSSESLLRRLIAAEAEINAFYTRAPHALTDSQKESWTTAVGEISELKLQIFDKPMQTIQEIRSKVRKVKKMYPDKNIVVMIDYLTLIRNTGKFPSDHAKVSDTSARLKALAKEYDCPVITLAQLSRGVEQRPNKRPQMSDLRESGSIEQDADVGLLLYRESYYDEKNTDNELEINIAKHRDGPTGTVTVKYYKAKGVIED